MNYLIYLGKRGGGAHLLSEIVSEIPEYKESNWTVIKSSHNHTLEETGLNLVEIPTPIGPKGYSRYFLSVFNLLKVQKKESGSTDNIFVFIQNSPWDLPLLVVYKLRGSNFWVAIHDWKRHRGDVWPPAIVTRFLILISNHFIVFSTHAIRELKIKGEVIVLKLPGTHKSLYQVASNSPSKVVVFLSIGRIRKYKGLETFNRAISVSRNSDFYFKLVGEGKLSFRPSPELHFENRWLTDQEFLQEIQSADVVVLPYIEASQSGIIPIAIEMNKVILVTNTPSLVDQIKSYNYERYMTFEVDDHLGMSNAFEVAARNVSKLPNSGSNSERLFQSGFWQNF
jgi:glycosyltransferase involved in cell wall biosynthesis